MPDVTEMTTAEYMRIAINLHTRTVVALLDAVERADTPKQKAERLYLIRDAVIEFKGDLLKLIK